MGEHATAVIKCAIDIPRRSPGKKNGLSALAAAAEAGNAAVAERFSECCLTTKRGQRYGTRYTTICEFSEQRRPCIDFRIRVTRHTSRVCGR